eukprot:PhF_6_TR27495/c1_g1_i1/m.40382
MYRAANPSMPMASYPPPHQGVQHPQGGAPQGAYAYQPPQQGPQGGAYPGAYGGYPGGYFVPSAQMYGVPYGGVGAGGPMQGRTQRPGRPRPSREVQAKTLCCFFVQGQCRFGEKCRYLHNDQGQECQFGKSCRIGHHLRNGRPGPPQNQPAPAQQGAPIQALQQ